MRISDWSSDVCSSDLELDLKIGTALPQTGNLAFLGPPEEAGVGYAASLINEISDETGLSLEVDYGDSGDTDNKAYETERTEERRGGKEWVSTWRYRWSPTH